MFLLPLAQGMQSKVCILVLDQDSQKIDTELTWIDDIGMHHATFPGKKNTITPTEDTE